MSVPRVVLVRPWTDGHGGGCCGGEVRDGVCLDGRRAPSAPGGAVGPADAADPGEGAPDPVGAAWRALRAALPEADLQVVDAGNPWLAAHVLGAVRRRDGLVAGLRAAVGSSSAGSVLVDGRRVGDLEELGTDGTVAAVLAAATG